tara:strand:+ start:293 stop:430 length:138 start_codon:yes stop_codon:yes gene_type:complete
MPSSGSLYEASWMIFATELLDNFILSLKLTANEYLQDRCFPRLAG